MLITLDPYQQYIQINNFVLGKEVQLPRNKYLRVSKREIHITEENITDHVGVPKIKKRTQNGLYESIELDVVFDWLSSDKGTVNQKNRTITYRSDNTDELTVTSILDRTKETLTIKPRKVQIKFPLNKVTKLSVILKSQRVTPYKNMIIEVIPGTHGTLIVDVPDVQIINKGTIKGAEYSNSNQNSKNGIIAKVPFILYNRGKIEGCHAKDISGKPAVPAKPAQAAVPAVPDKVVKEKYLIKAAWVETKTEYIQRPAQSQSMLVGKNLHGSFHFADGIAVDTKVWSDYHTTIVGKQIPGNVVGANVGVSQGPGPAATVNVTVTVSPYKLKTTKKINHPAQYGYRNKTIKGHPGVPAKPAVPYKPAVPAKPGCCGKLNCKGEAIQGPVTIKERGVIIP